MANNAYDFTKEYSFHGEFWQDIKDNKGRFPAKIEYSPYNGLTLDYCISDSEAPLECKRLYGILNTGQICTLIGNFNFSHGAVHLSNIKILTGKHGFQVLLFNEFHDENSLIEYCDLAPYGMQEFIHPQGFISHLKYSKTPLLTTQGNDFKIDIINNATFNMIGDGLVSVVDCRNEDALDKFTKDYLSTKKAFPDALFLLRKTLKFYLRYTNTSDTDLLFNISKLWSIISIFSILLDKPIIPEELHVKVRGNNERRPCLFSNSIEQRTIDLALSDINHHMLPLNWRDVDLGEILKSWLEISDDYNSLSATYQNETGYRTLHQAHADIILYATQLESINLSLNGTTGVKYTGPIDKYGKETIRKNLESIFSKFNNNDLGKNISDLRNELAHVGRPKILMKKMEIDDYIRIGLYLKVIVTSHLLSQLGLVETQIHKYQKKVIM